MASKSTYLYKNTGFNTYNCPDGPGVVLKISSSNRITCDSVWLLQDLVGKIKVKATWDEVKDVDYCQITSTFYFVTNVTMSNENTAILDLQLDPIGTIGILQIDIINGWCTRRHVANDELFSNNLEEGYTPLEEMTVDFSYLNHLTGDVVSMVILGSTIDLSQTFDAAKTFVDQQSKLSVSVPLIKGVERETRTFLFYLGDYRGKSLPSTLLYMANSSPVAPANIRNALSSVWSLGLTDAITSSYIVEWPADEIHEQFQDGTVETTQFGELVSFGLRPVTITLPDSFKYIWTVPNYTIKNNKVFSGQYNKYAAISIATGASINYNANDLYYTGDTFPTFLVIGDPAPDGCTYLVPKYYHNKELQSGFPLYGGLKGGTWVNNQLTFSGREGGMVSAEMYQMQLQQQRLSRTGAFFKGLEDVLTMPLRVASSPFTSTPQDPPLDTNNFWQVSDRLLALNNYPGYGPKEYMKEYPASSGFPAVDMSGLANSLYTNPAKAKLAQQQLELSQGISQNLNAPKIYFPFGSNLNTYFGNGFYGIRSRLSDNDTIRFDKFLTAFGYATNEPFDKSAFTCREHFNYVQVSDLNVKIKNNNYGIRIRNMLEQILNNGIRIWHELPNKEAFDDNPIKQ